MSYAVPQGYQHSPYSLSVRPITDGERKVALDSLKFFRYNAVGSALVGMMTAIATMFFATDIVMLLVPLLFVLMAGDYAAKYKKSSDAIAKALGAGAVVDISGVPEKKSRSTWILGPVAIAGRGVLGKALLEGATSKMAFLPGTQMVLSMNGTPLRKAALVNTTPADFGKDLVVPATSVAPGPPSPTITYPRPVTTEELPPPPDDWEELFCGRCGQRNPKDARFCGKCGAVIKR